MLTLFVLPFVSLPVGCCKKEENKVKEDLSFLITKETFNQIFHDLSNL
jgi:hypothetical protein